MSPPNLCLSPRDNETTEVLSFTEGWPCFARWERGACSGTHEGAGPSYSPSAALCRGARYACHPDTVWLYCEVIQDMARWMPITLYYRAPDSWLRGCILNGIVMLDDQHNDSLSQTSTR